MVLLMDFVLNTIAPMRKFPVSATMMMTLYANVLAAFFAVGLPGHPSGGRVPLVVVLRFAIQSTELFLSYFL